MSEKLEPTLRELSERGDIIKTMQRFLDEEAEVTAIIQQIKVVLGS